MSQGTILVDYVLTDEDMDTMEIPYYQTQILVPPNQVTPLVFIVPSQFTFESTKEVPWNYDFMVYINRQKQEEKLLLINESVVNIVVIGGMTKSGRVFTSTPPPEKKNIEASTKHRGKQIFNVNHGYKPHLNKYIPKYMDELI